MRDSEYVHYPVFSFKEINLQGAVPLIHIVPRYAQTTKQAAASYIV